jgi:hypothetical protein
MGKPLPALIPKEIWMLWTGNTWVLAIDDPRGGENFLACISEADAIACATHQNDTYNINCFPVRVK